MMRFGDAISVFQSTLPLRGVTAPSGKAFHTEEFQSTLPLRGVTRGPIIGDRIGGISIHTPLAGSDSTHPLVRLGRIISIHTPLAGSDAANGSIPVVNVLFQSTLPLRGVTRHVDVHPCSFPFQSTLPLRGVTCPSPPA